MGGLEKNDVKERKKRKDKGDEKEEKKHLGESIDQSETKRCSDWLAEEEESLGNCEVRMGRGGWLARSRRKIRGEYERNSVEQKRKLSVWEEERLGVASAVAGEREEDGSERSSHRAGSSHDSRYKTILIGRTMRVGLWGGSVVGAERVDHGALCSLRPVKLFIVPRSSLSLSLSRSLLSALLSFSVLRAHRPLCPFPVALPPLPSTLLFSLLSRDPR